MESKTFCFDIDGTILTTVEDGNYEMATPIPGRIEHLRTLKAAGHTILLFTARGSKSGEDWRERTALQMKDLNIPFDELILGKPHADLYVDDKGCDANLYDWNQICE